MLKKTDESFKKSKHRSHLLYSVKISNFSYEILSCIKIKKYCVYSKKINRVKLCASGTIKLLF